jgi:two-component system, NarL family, nitrate/nitrite response regulator NarL
MPSARADRVVVFLIAPPMVCWGLERLVQSAQPKLELVGTAPSVKDSLKPLEQHAPDVVVLDLDDGDADRSLATLQASTSAKLLLLTGSQDLAMLDRAVLAGVRGVVRKSDPPSLLLKAIELIHAGELWIDRGATGRIFMEMARQKLAQNNDPEKGKIATLTLRERKTIAAMTSDASVPAKVIAGRLCISEHTLRNHLTSVYAKLGLTNRLDLYAYAARHQLNQLS